MTQQAITAPHALAAEAGAGILAEGGTAIEAMVAAAAAISVVYPHMNAIGGDGFWLIHRPGEQPHAIDACGRAAALATPEFYGDQSVIPARGAASALTSAGTIAGWDLALKGDSNARLPLARLLAPAIDYARSGFETSISHQQAAAKLYTTEARNAAFKTVYEIAEQPLMAGQTFRNPALANTFEQLASKGLSDFYRGEIAEQSASYLQSIGSPLRMADLSSYQAEWVEPLTIKLRGSQLFNLPAPTQGAASLMILAIVDQLRDQLPANSEVDWVHLLVEATKRAFMLRNKAITDPGHCSEDYRLMTTADRIAFESQQIDLQQAAAWPHIAEPGDTVWMGAVDKQGTMVSFIQSVYWEFGSGIAIPELGFVWNNRGTSFSLQSDDLNRLRPGCKPFHTLNPALALFDDGRRLSYGTMGGEGQPQTQAALFSRYAWREHTLDKAISHGRWLLGRTWGDESHNLKIEQDLADEVADALLLRGHEIATVESCNELMGHAGAVLNHVDGSVESVTDPRSDGKAIVIS